MQKIVSLKKMRDIERAADTSGLTYDQMMENAGRSLACAIFAHSLKGMKFALAIVGPGNNGGDALVASGLLAKAGWKSAAFLVGKRKKSDRLVKKAGKAGVKFLSSQKTFKSALLRCDLLLDGLLGTGIQLPLRDPFSDVLAHVGETIAQRAVPPFVVAVDCPSGMDCDSGALAPETIKADLSVTLAAVKLGMLTLPAYAYLGKLEVGEIGLPDDLPAWVAIHRLVIDEDLARRALPSRPLEAHKGTFGTALIVAGSQRFPGAALLAGEAAYRSGAGLVTLAVPEVVQPAIAGHLSEATWLPLPHEGGWISAAGADLVSQNLERVTAMLLGPGFGQESTSKKFLDQLLGAKLPPLVVDADGLKLLARLQGWQERLPDDSVLTPHPGEMSVLTGLLLDDIQAKRIEMAERYAQAWKQIVVLKGAFTVVAAPDGRCAVLPLATPALARAGTGDVLAGLITGLRAQGMPAFEAACSAVWLHGQAGLQAAARLGGTAGVLARDLISELPALIAR
ncbi:MAG: NAD(P)H-hydrate dehydratase [Anaerolineales bacterium]